MITLAIDTSASLCAAAVLDDDVELGRAVIDLGKGHAEHLMAVIDDALNAADVDYAGLDRVAVAIGPGSFTGIRVGVATARGLALALKIPAIGVSNLEAVADEARRRQPGHAVLTAFTSVQDTFQAALYDRCGNPECAPAVIGLAHAVHLAASHNAVVTGSAAAMLAAFDSTLTTDGDAVTADIGTYARLAAHKPVGDKPKPLYLREPDAKPQAGFVLPRAAS